MNHWKQVCLVGHPQNDLRRGLGSSANLPSKPLHMDVCSWADYRLFDECENWCSKLTPNFICIWTKDETWHCKCHALMRHGEMVTELFQLRHNPAISGYFSWTPWLTIFLYWIIYYNIKGHRTRRGRRRGARLKILQKWSALWHFTTWPWQNRTSTARFHQSLVALSVVWPPKIKRAKSSKVIGTGLFHCRVSTNLQPNRSASTIELSIAI